MEATTNHALLELLVVLIWACLLVPTVGKNHLFAQLFFDIDVVKEVASMASLCFCPGLLQVLEAMSPPTLSWFKSLPSKHLGRWGVYVLVFEKKGCRPYVYVGSGTDARYGVTSRWTLYDKHNLYLRDNTDGLPSQVIWAFKQGYKISHKGLLVSAPVPSAANVPTFRLLFVAMEATFSFAFWVMKPIKNDYGMLSCCRWELSTFTYGGLCTHSALNDPIKGNFDLTAAELTDLDITNRERRNRYNIEYRARAMAIDPEARLAKEREWSETYRNANREAYNARSRAFAAADRAHSNALKELSRIKTKESAKYRCEICLQSCVSQWELDRHNRSSKHNIRAAKVARGVKFIHNCLPCDFMSDVKGSLTRHQASPSHKAKMASIT
jgi:hypothetical protein